MTTLESMRIVARHFNEMKPPYAFLGAAVLPLLVDTAAVLEIRPTQDVDLSVEIATLGEHYQLEDHLRKRGFKNDIREGAPIGRWVVEEITVDVMPTEGSVLGLASLWFKEAVQQARPKDLREGVAAPVITRPYFLATKLAAYKDRGASDPLLSKDLEDIVTLFDGCTETMSLCTACPKDVHVFITREMHDNLDDPDFVDAVMGNFRSDTVSRERSNIILQRIRNLSQTTFSDL